jgi:hypothetical protein
VGFAWGFDKGQKENKRKNIMLLENYYRKERKKVEAVYIILYLLFFFKYFSFMFCIMDGFLLSLLSSLINYY